MANAIIIDYKGKGLTKPKITEVIKILRSAKVKGKLPAMTYEYNPRPMLFGKDPINLKTKGAPLTRTAMKVRQIIREAVGNKYSVRLG